MLSGKPNQSSCLFPPKVFFPKENRGTERAKSSNRPYIRAFAPVLSASVVPFAAVELAGILGAGLRGLLEVGLRGGKGGLEVGLGGGLDDGLEPGLELGLEPGLGGGAEPGLEGGLDVGLEPGLDGGLPYVEMGLDVGLPQGDIGCDVGLPYGEIGLEIGRLLVGEPKNGTSSWVPAISEMLSLGGAAMDSGRELPGRELPGRRPERIEKGPGDTGLWLRGDNPSWKSRRLESYIP